MVRNSKSLKDMKKIIITIISCLSLLSCKKERPNFGMGFNEERKKIGLPVLSENWKYKKIIGGDGKTERWINPRPKYPCQLIKTVTFDQNKKIIYEKNTYYGVNTFPSIDAGDATMTESLFISYYFQDEKRKNDWSKEKLKKKGWNCSFYSQKTQSSGNTEITKEQADSILVAWGIKYQ